MKSQIIAEFPHATDCFEESNEFEIRIHDDAIKCKSCIHTAIGKPKYPFFTVRNPNKKPITLVQIDNCVYTNADGERCDFATYDDKDFYFVELKRALGANLLLRRENKRKSMSQLKSTLSFLLPKLDFSSYKLFACSCVGYSSPRPAAKASDLSLRVEFLNNYSTNLLEGNFIDFK